MRAWVAAMCVACAAWGGDIVVPRELAADPATLENLGFRWFIEGDDNRNARVEVEWRRKGGTWRKGHPLLRVNEEVVNQDYQPHRLGRLFAGSVLFLEPGADYEVKFLMTDPDGAVRAERVLAARTRSVPVKPAGGARRVVTAADGVAGLRAALAAAEPGDRIVMQAGMYEFRETLHIDKRGTAEKPIVVEAAGDGEVIWHGAGYGVDLVNAEKADHLWLDGLTLQSARHAVLAGRRGERGASGLIVTRSRIRGVIWGIRTESEYSEGWYLADNELEGTNPTWYPRPNAVYMSPSHTGINVYGRGHVVVHNRISRFSDGIAPANFGPPRAEPALHPVSVDIARNDISWAQDDCIETDYGAHNFRVYENRCTNAHTGVSTQPFYGGPVYVIRNEVYGVTALGLKLHNWCAGLEIYHNTLVSAGVGFQSYDRWQNGHFRNNLFLGGRGTAAMTTGTATAYSTLDYNGYRRNGEGTFIRWYDGAQRRTFASLEEFRAATGHEQHGRMVDYDIFERAEAPERGRTLRPGEWDARLRAGSVAEDAGVALPGINDGYRGRAPDLGAHERGAPVPEYGPRRPPPAPR